MHALDRVVRVDEKHAVVGHGLGVGGEGFELVVEDHDPAVGVGAFDGDTVELAGQDVGGGGASPDVRGATRGDGAVDALGASEAELEDGLALGGVADAGGLGGDEGLEVEDVEKGSLDELGLEQGAADAKHRRVRKHGGAFRDGVDVAGELHLLEVVEESPFEERGSIVARERFEEVDVSLLEADGAEVVDGFVESGGDGVAASEGILAEEEVEHGFALAEPGLPVPVGHGELVQVGEQGERVAVESGQRAQETSSGWENVNGMIVDGGWVGA